MAGFLLLAQAPASYDAATTAWEAAVTTANGSIDPVSSGQKTIVDTFIKALKNASSGNLFALMDRIYVFGLANESQVEAKVSLVKNGANVPNDTTTLLTSHGAVTLNGSGAVGDGSTGYFDTGYNPSTGAVNFAQNSKSIIQYFTNARVSASTNISFGSFDGTNYVQYIPYTGAVARCFDTGTSDFTCSSTQGLFVFTRNSSTTTNFYQNSNAGSSTGISSTSAAFPNGNFYILARNNSGVADSFISDTMTFCAWGAVLSTAQALDFQNAVHAMMASLPAGNTY